MTSKGHFDQDDCIFGIKFYAKGRNISPDANLEKVMRLIKTECYIEKKSGEIEITRWKTKLENLGLNPFYEPGHYLRGKKMIATNCESGVKRLVGGSTGRHRGQNCSLSACGNNPAICFILLTISGVDMNYERVEENKILAKKFVETGDLPEKIGRLE